MTSPGEQFFRDLYEAFNARDIDAALAGMQPDVDWANGMEGGREHGHAAVREYWTRQFAQIDSHVEPVGFTTRDDGRIALDVHAVVRTPGGELIADRQVVHVYTLREGLVERMDIED